MIHILKSRKTKGKASLQKKQRKGDKMNAVTVNNVKIKYDKTVILNNINLNIEKGQIIGLLGPSGSGKTTLVKAIIGMKEVCQGEISIFDTKIPSLKITTMMGYMAQSDALYEDLNAIDNVLFFAALYGMNKKAAIDRAKEVLSLVNLLEDSKKLVKNFSGGMKRRLSLAIALVHNPKLLILDEPTVGIDPVLRKIFWDEFTKLKNNGTTIIVTTHVMDEAYRCDKLSLIRNGDLIANGTPNELIKNSNSANIEEAFLYYSSTKGDL